jgi:hypothetical protein
VKAQTTELARFSSGVEEKGKQAYFQEVCFVKDGTIHWRDNEIYSVNGKVYIWNKNVRHRLFQFGGPGSHAVHWAPILRLHLPGILHLTSICNPCETLDYLYAVYLLPPLRRRSKAKPNYSTDVRRARSFP